MAAEIIAVGSELLRAGRSDTNGAWLQARLEQSGIEVAARCRVDDDVARIASLVRSALERADVVAVLGGLGPTVDDRTREALAVALGAPLERDPERASAIEARLAARGLPLSPAQARQADRPRGTRWIDNPIGSAPGVLFERERRLLFALPGVPAEMMAMFDAGVLPLCAGRGSGALARCRILVAGLTESAVDAAIAELYGVAGLDLTILGAADGVELHFLARARAAAGAAELCASAERRVRELLGPAIVGAGDETLARAVGRLLGRARLTVATAESCTAGLLGAALTAVPGSSTWYRGGVVAYADDLKIALAGVAGSTLGAHGAVSEAVARELARGARERCGADIGIGVTGIAGPAGGGPEKPVGLVHVGLDHAGASDHVRRVYAGDRETVRRRTVALALDRLRRRLLAAP